MNDKKLKYNSINEYLKYIRENLPRIKVPQAGLLVQMNYLFTLNPDYKKHPEKKKGLDFFPIDLILATQPSKKLMLCVSLHNFPVATRQILIARIRKEYPNPFTDKPRIRIPGMNYFKMLRYLKKMKIAIRKYRYERIKDFRVIPTEHLDTLLKFYPNTFYGTNYNAKVRDYNRYIP